MSGIESRLRALQATFSSLVDHRPFLSATGACERARTALLLATAERGRLRDVSSDPTLRSALSAVANAEAAVEELVRLVEPTRAAGHVVSEPPRTVGTSPAAAAPVSGKG
ncbi:MAG TPA: hypothetical protein VFM29_07370 [Vicinamibacteria bacterium]|nr:hypothetical protein [Vicinamibacteria bacterium]